MGGRQAREFNKAQILTLAFGDATINVANVHIPSSKKHPKKDLDVTYALRNLSGIDASGGSGGVASSHAALPPTMLRRIIVGDINEKQMHTMGDRLRMAHGGAGRWRHWQTQKTGHGDHVVYECSLERVRSVVDEQWQSTFVTPHHATGGFFVPSRAWTDDMVENVLRHVAGDAIDMARHAPSHGVGRLHSICASCHGVFEWCACAGWSECAVAFSHGVRCVG